MKVKSTHPFAFRSGSWGIVIGTVYMTEEEGYSPPRACFIVKYGDVYDLLPIYDPDNKLEFDK